MKEVIELSKEDMERLIKISRFGVGAAFIWLVLMLFHVLIDFFYHT